MFPTGKGGLPAQYADKPTGKQSDDLLRESFEIMTTIWLPFIYKSMRQNQNRSIIRPWKKLSIWSGGLLRSGVLSSSILGAKSYHGFLQRGPLPLWPPPFKKEIQQRSISIFQVQKTKTLIFVDQSHDQYFDGSQKHPLKRWPTLRVSLKFVALLSLVMVIHGSPFIKKLAIDPMSICLGQSLERS